MSEQEGSRAERETRAVPAAVRDAVDERDQMHCRVCGKFLGERRAHHHIVYGGDDRGMGGRRVHNPAEIVTICSFPGDPDWGVRPCHDRVHNDKSYWQPLLLECAARPGVTALQLARWRREGRRVDDS